MIRANDPHYTGERPKQWDVPMDFGRMARSFRPSRSKNYTRIGSGRPR
jgi:hypothetical protein